MHKIIPTSYRLAFSAAVLFFFIPVFAGDLDKAFKYLNTGDYPNASKYLREVILEEPGNAAVNYGMAKYFSFRDNKDYNLDSANFYIKLAAKKLPLNPDDKQTKKFLALGVRDYTIESLQKTINFDAYAVAEKDNTLESYQHFIDHYTDPGLLTQAVSLRNQKAYIRALSYKTPEALDEFIKKYPDAAEVKRAVELFEKMLYERITADRNYASYKKYMDSFPSGAFYKLAKQNYEAKVLEYYLQKNNAESYSEFLKLYKTHPGYALVEDSLYRLITAGGTIEDYRKFIQAYRENRNVKDAWEQLYILFTAEATEEAYKTFKAYYPDFPAPERIEKDIELAKLNLRPIQQGDKYGYAWQPAPDSIAVIIPFQFEEAFEFKCGYAAVREKECNDSQCVYFYIDKTDRRAITNNYNYAGDFTGGYAVVGLGNCETDECKYGIIDKRGKFIVAPEYDEIDDPTGGLYLAAKGDKYGFINYRSAQLISFKYTDALPFSEGLAAVAIDSFWFFIDTAGVQKFLTVYRDVSSFKYGLCAVTPDKTGWGYIDTSGAFVIEPLYEWAGDFEGGFAIVAKKEKDPKNKSLFISQRYKIDRTGKIIEKLTAPKEPAKKSGRKKRGK